MNAEGYREILGLEVTSEESGAGWLAFFRSLVARGLSGVRLVTSDAHAGLVAAIGAALPGATWQRCRTRYLRELLQRVAEQHDEWAEPRRYMGLEILQKFDALGATDVIDTALGGGDAAGDRIGRVGFERITWWLALHHAFGRDPRVVQREFAKCDPVHARAGMSSAP